MTEKPLFIPLKAEYYDQFVSGRKTCELRLDGKRWNERTCHVARSVTLSRGYGKQHRMIGTIRNTYAVEDFKNPDFMELYGAGETCRVIEIWVNRPCMKREQKSLGIAKFKG
ncbi:hypothetical protein KAR91_57500 [Candidatus Pacearchaeota archaeon]|nr:hypothetical protein [Candidatus Pacearchaeota archaeon]